MYYKSIVVVSQIFFRIFAINYFFCKDFNLFTICVYLYLKKTPKTDDTKPLRLRLHKRFSAIKLLFFVNVVYRAHSGDCTVIHSG